MKKATKPSDVRSGIALAATAFIISIFLYFQPQYFGVPTKAIAIIFIVIGFGGLGIELEKLTSDKRRSTISSKKGSGIFDNLGIGFALFIAWATIYYYFPIVWVNVLTSVFLIFGVYGMTLGFTNIFFRATSKSRAKSNSNNSDPKEISFEQKRTHKPQPVAIKIAVAASGVLGFIASLIQILQFLKIIR